MENYHLAPVLTDEERAVILFNVSRAVYERYFADAGNKVSWDELAFPEKLHWQQSVRVGLRVLFLGLSQLGEE